METDVANQNAQFENNSKDIDIPKDVFDSLDDDDFMVNTHPATNDDKSETTTDDNRERDENDMDDIDSDDTNAPPEEQPFDKSEKASKSKTPEDKPDDESRSEETSMQNDEETDTDETDETEEANEGPSFHDQVAELLMKFDTPEKQEQLLKDLGNHEKFMATNTQKSQEVADDRKKVEEERRQLETFKAAIQSGELVQAIEQIRKLKDLPQVLESLDEWYGGESKNEFRPLLKAFESLDSAKEAVDKHDQEQNALREKESMLDLKAEILDLQQFDPSYRDDARLNELAKFADGFKIPIDLVTAAKLKERDVLSAKVKQLQSDLKVRNKRIAELEKNPRLTPEPKPITKGRSSKRTAYETPPQDEFELDKRMEETWDTMMIENR